MIIPNYVQDKIVDEKGLPTDAFSSFLITLLQNMQLSLSDEGYLIPNVTDSQKTVIQNSFKTNTVNPNTQTVTVGVQTGTVVFDRDTVNGGSSMAPLGQLFVLLNDGTFHAIPNL